MRRPHLQTHQGLPFLKKKALMCLEIYWHHTPSQASALARRSVAKIYTLGGEQRLDGQDVLQVIRDSNDMLGSGEAQTDMVFDVGR